MTVLCVYIKKAMLQQINVIETFCVLEKESYYFLAQEINNKVLINVYVPKLRRMKKVLVISMEWKHRGTC